MRDKQQTSYQLMQNIAVCMDFHLDRLKLITRCNVYGINVKNT